MISMIKMARKWEGQCYRAYAVAVIGLVFTACTPAPEKTNGRVASGAAPASATPSVVPTTSANPSPSPSPTPGAPQFAVLSPAATSTDLAPTVTWSEAPGASDYTLAIGADAACTHPVQNYSSIVNREQPLQTLAKGVWYVCLNAIVANQSVPATNSGYKMTLTGHAPTLAYVSNTNLNNFQGAGTQASPYTFTVPQTASASLVLTAADLDPGDLPVIVCHNLPSWGVLGSSGTEVDFNTVGTAIGPAVAFTTPQVGVVCPAATSDGVRSPQE